MIGEIGEVIDIVKKYGDIEPTNDVELRNHLVGRNGGCSDALQ